MENQRSMGDQFLSMVDQIIEENLDNENFSVEDLAQKAGLSRSMLHRKLNKLIKKSASALISERRLDHAKTLLENDVATVSEIAFRVGFSDPSYFNKVFKKHFGISPGNIRKNHLHDQSRQSIDQKVEMPHSSGSKRIRLSAKTMIILTIIIIACSGIYYVFGVDRVAEKSIAVLPLNNLTGQAEMAYFVDGMHDAIIGELGQISSLRVISRTSTLCYRDSNMLLAEIANELDVNTIVEGSVIRAGDSLRLLIQLIDVFPKERHILVREYNGEMQNVLSIQPSVVEDIAQKIRVKLSRKEEELIAQSTTVDPETYKAFLRGMHYLNQGTEDSFNKGIDYLIDAIDRDPGDPFAYAHLALGYAIRGHGLILPAESFKSAEAAANKAIIIDPSMDEAHTALALLYLYQYWDWSKAQLYFESALASNPNNDIAHAHYAWYFVLMNDMERSLFHAKRAVDLNPLSASYQSWLAWLYYDNSDYDQAEHWAQKSLERQNDNPFGNLVLGWVYLERDQFEKAIETHEKLPNTGATWRWFRCRTYVLTGNEEKALAIWKEMEEYSKNNWVNPFYPGMMAGILGYKDEAFKFLNEAYENKYHPMFYIDVFPSVEFIKNDPRYATLLRKMNLPDDISKFASAQE